MDGPVTQGAPEIGDAHSAARSSGEASPSTKVETLPPPEWTAPAAPSRARMSYSPPPLVRRSGRRADEGQLRARLEAARAAGETVPERDLSMQLAHYLAARERDYDEAVRLGKRALDLEEQEPPASRAPMQTDEQRRELGTWLEGLGEPGLAAAELRKLAQRHAGDGPAVAALMVRAGVLYARGGDAQKASDAFATAAKANPQDALALEMRATLASWAPDVVTPEGAAAGFAEAAARRGAAGQASKETELEDVLRAFEADPAFEPAAKALAGVLEERGARGAADEVWRAHAAALVATSPEKARQIHARRRAAALGDDGIARALGAALDEGLDALTEGEGAIMLDELLSRAGLLEPLAERLELRAERTKDAPDRGALYMDLARLYGGPLSNALRAAQAHVRALAADPALVEATLALRAYASSARDSTLLVEGLIRAASAPEHDDLGRRAGRLAAARTLGPMAERELGEVGLAMWAYERVLVIVPDDAEALAGVQRVGHQVNAQYAELVRSRNELASTSESARIDALKRITAVLRGMPSDEDILAEMLSELSRHDRRYAVEAARLASRRGDHAEAARLARERTLDPDLPLERRVEALLVYALAAREAGQLSDAVDAARSALEMVAPKVEGEASPRALVSQAASVAWMCAAAASDAKLRAVSIALLATQCPLPLGAELSAVAAELLLQAGDMDAARQAAERGARAAPDDARCAATLADVAGRIRPADRLAVAAIERAARLVFPRSAWCCALAQGLEDLGDLDLSVAWTQRAVALRPGDRRIVELVFQRIVRAEGVAGRETMNVARLGDAIAWALTQPKPSRELSDMLAQPLNHLAELDPDRAVIVARRALDVLGPRHNELRASLLAAADRARDDAFGAAIVDRWLASGAPKPEREAALVALADRRSRSGDNEGEVRTLVRALREGPRASDLTEKIVTLVGDGLSGDGEIAFLEARAELLSARGEGAHAAKAWREVGGAVWDLAGDRPRAVRAWEKAARLAPTRGYTTLAQDLARFADSSYAQSVLEDLAAREPEALRVGAILAETARIAFAHGESARAFELARRALENNPSQGSAIETAERASAACDRALEMSPVYDALARRALGRFGRRAAHYRGARFFEGRGRLDLALKHAAEAFTAVPSEGSTLTLLSRTADRAQARGVAVRAVEQVAELASNNHARSAWLLRAAAIAGSGEEGIRQRFDVLLRAVVLAPDNGTLSYLADTARELMALVPEEREMMQMRLERAADALAKKIDGPEGARVAIAFAELTLDLFGDADAALRSLERALAADGDLEEFARLVPKAAALARSEGAPASLFRAMSAAQKPYANVGVPALRMLGALAGALGNVEVRAKALVMAVERDQDDDSLVCETDEALTTYRDEALSARFAKKVPEERRVESLRAHAREQSSVGHHDAAVQALERAVVSAGERERATVHAELQGAYEAAGFNPDLEQRLLRDAEDGGAEVVARADKWAEIASGREGLGDLNGAADALLEATRLDPEPLGRWSELERVAEAARRHDLRVAALERIVEQLGEEEQAVPAMKRLARALEASGAQVAAEALWKRVAVLLPGDEEIDYAIEGLVTARGDYEELAAQLARRAERLGANPATREALRPVRLRRAAILEQRLDRIDEACEELERLLAEWPENESALCYLADLYERTGHAARAIPLWRRVSGLTRDPERHTELALRAVRACVTAGELDRALDEVRAILTHSPTEPDALELRVEIARSLESTRELGDALAALAIASTESATVRSDMLVEAAQSAARAGDMAAALERAQTAALIAPFRAKTQLFARGLEYRVRGSGAPDEAHQAIDALGRIEEPLDGEDAALQTFLLAEALDAVQGGGAGLRKLSERFNEVGPHPLIAIGMAERMVAQWNFAAAVPLFDAALRGNLLGLRRRGIVALAAAEAATRADRKDEAARFLDEAAADPETRTAALRRIAQLAAAGGDILRSRKVLLELARGAEGVERARHLAELGRALFTSQESQDRIDGGKAFTEAIESAGSDHALAAELEEELRDLRKRQSVAPRAVMHSWPPPDLAPAPEAAVEIVGVPAEAAPSAPVAPIAPAAPDLSVEDLEKAVEDASEPSQRASRRVMLAHAKLQEGHSDEAEKILWQAFVEGSIEAGDQLAARLESKPARVPELMRARRQLVDMVPGDPRRLDALRAAAQLDQNMVYARAIEHVLRAFDRGAGPLPPPPLSAQREQPRLLDLLERHSREPAGEAMALVWDGATSVFAKTAATYALTGLERVVPGASSILARLYEISVRLLDAPRLPLFVRKGISAPSSTVALLTQASAIFTGDAREDTPDVRYALGQALSGALPQNALVLGLAESEARVMWNALLGAFGPTEMGRQLDATTGHLAETFWQVLPPRTQRRLKELLEGARKTRFELVAERARQSGRRVALFLTGDFGHVARALAHESGAFEVEELAAPGGLASVCSRVPALADLFRLAVRPEYADARWQLETPPSRRLSSGRIKVL